MNWIIFIALIEFGVIFWVETDRKISISYMFSVFSVQWVDGSPVLTEKLNSCSQCQFNIEFVYSEI